MMIKIYADIFLICLAISFFNIVSLFYKSINYYSNSFAAGIAFFNTLSSMLIVPYYIEKNNTHLFYLLLFIFIAINVICAARINKSIGEKNSILSILGTFFYIFSPIYKKLKKYIFHNSYLRSNKLDFKTPIDNIKIEDSGALKILSEVNNDLIPKYEKCKEYADEFERNEMKNQDVIHDFNLIREKIINKCDEIKQILNKSKENKMNEEYDKFHKIINND